MRWVALVHCNQTVNIRMKVCQEQSQISTLCYVEFVSLFGEETGHSDESPLNEVRSRKSNKKNNLMSFHGVGYRFGIAVWIQKAW